MVYFVVGLIDWVRTLRNFVMHTSSENDDELTLEDYGCSWQVRQEHALSCEAIREGLDDLNAGRVRPADEIISELRQRGLSKIAVPVDLF